MSVSTNVESTLISKIILGLFQACNDRLNAGKVKGYICSDFVPSSFIMRADYFIKVTMYNSTQENNSRDWAKGPGLQFHN